MSSASFPRDGWGSSEVAPVGSAAPGLQATQRMCIVRWVLMLLSKDVVRYALLLGVLVQLVDRLLCMQEVLGSKPRYSIFPFDV